MLNVYCEFGPQRWQARARGQQIDDSLNRLVGLMVCGVESAVGTVCEIGLIVETAVGQRPTQALVKEEE
jgi:hypothetical protein